MRSQLYRMLTDCFIDPTPALQPGIENFSGARPARERKAWTWASLCRPCDGGTRGFFPRLRRFHAAHPPHTPRARPQDDARGARQRRRALCVTSTSPAPLHARAPSKTTCRSTVALDVVRRGAHAREDLHGQFVRKLVFGHFEQRLADGMPRRRDRMPWQLRSTPWWLPKKASSA